MSARPVLDKIINTLPLYVYYVPHGVSEDRLEEVSLTLEEFEALNLKDKQELDQVDSAKKMGISQPTFHRLLLSARRTVASAITNGKAIKIQGGTFKQAGLSFPLDLSQIAHPDKSLSRYFPIVYHRS